MTIYKDNLEEQLSFYIAQVVCDYFDDMEEELPDDWEGAGFSERVEHIMEEIRLEAKDIAECLYREKKARESEGI